MALLCVYTNCIYCVLRLLNIVLVGEGIAKNTKIIAGAIGQMISVI